jgi:hypothetical protein
LTTTTTTRTITITKEIEEKMRLHIEAAASPSWGSSGCWCDCYCSPDEDSFLEANELLKALGIEPSEDFAKDLAYFRSFKQEPPVHTCRISTEMEIKEILDSLEATLKDCESD